MLRRLVFLQTLASKEILVHLSQTTKLLDIKVKIVLSCRAMQMEAARMGENIQMNVYASKTKGQGAKIGIVASRVWYPG